MQLVDVLDERIIDLNVGVANKKEVLTLLAGKLENAGYIADVEASEKDIYLRESEGTTRIGNYIAILHEKSNPVAQVGIAIAELKHEIEWETLDDKGVRLIFPFAVSSDHEYAHNHMLLLTDIARKPGDDEVVEYLLQVENVEELKEIFTGKQKVPHLSPYLFQGKERKGSIKNTMMNRGECRKHSVIQAVKERGTYK